MELLLSHRKYLYLLIVPLLVALLLLLGGETGSREAFRRFTVGDTLHFAIDRYRGGYYLRHAEPAGYQLERIRAFAGKQRAAYRLRVLSSPGERRDALLAGQVDVMVCAPGEYTADSLTVAFFFPDSAAWAVRTDNVDLMYLLGRWMGQFRHTAAYRLPHASPTVAVRTSARYSSLSPYDTLIKRFAGQLDWHWLLLAALVCQESRFRPDLQSPRGAVGLMQVLPATARQFGIDSLENPVNSMEAGVKVLLQSRKVLQLDSLDETNRCKFMLAAYNAGYGRIGDCRAFAVSQGRNPNSWDEVAAVIPLLRHKVHYTGEAVQLGRFRGTETLKFVREVWERYEHYRNLLDD